ncbi:hypothetical protein PPH41_11160 [Burkholderia gladioli]|nr:hypothetical protein [Burkholderia gladioli]
MVAWAPRLQAAEAAGRERETRRARAAAAAELTRPLLRAITLFEVLHRLDYRAVMLIALRQAEGGVRIDARARDSLAASRWLARLREARSDWQVEMSGVEGEPGQGTTGTIRFAVRIRWPDAVPLPRAARADFSVARGGRR